jgi:hypothetical protein
MVRLHASSCFSDHNGMNDFSKLNLYYFEVGRKLIQHEGFSGYADTGGCMMLSVPSVQSVGLVLFWYVSVIRWWMRKL